MFAGARLQDTVAALNNTVHDFKKKSNSISFLDYNQMKMPNRICLILLRNDCIFPCQMRRLVLGAAGFRVFVLHVSSGGVYQWRNVSDFARPSVSTSSFHWHMQCHHGICGWSQLILPILFLLAQFQHAHISTLQNVAMQTYFLI